LHRQKTPRSAEPGVPWPIVDLDGDDPSGAIIDSNEFAVCIPFFAEAEAEAAPRAPMPPNSYALLFRAARNTKPAHVSKIGTYQTATSDAFAIPSLNRPPRPFDGNVASRAYGCQDRPVRRTGKGIERCRI
jgi:hypothetical protein